MALTLQVRQFLNELNKYAKEPEDVVILAQLNDAANKVLEFISKRSRSDVERMALGLSLAIICRSISLLASESQIRSQKEIKKIRAWFARRGRSKDSEIINAIIDRHAEEYRRKKTKALSINVVAENILEGVNDEIRRDRVERGLPELRLGTSAIRNRLTRLRK